MVIEFIVTQTQCLNKLYYEPNAPSAMLRLHDLSLNSGHGSVYGLLSCFVDATVNNETHEQLSRHWALQKRRALSQFQNKMVNKNTTKAKTATKVSKLSRQMLKTFSAETKPYIRAVSASQEVGSLTNESAKLPRAGTLSRTWHRVGITACFVVSLETSQVAQTESLKYSQCNWRRKLCHNYFSFVVSNVTSCGVHTFRNAQNLENSVLNLIRPPNRSSVAASS